MILNLIELEKMDPELFLTMAGESRAPSTPCDRKKGMGRICQS